MGENGKCGGQSISSISPKGLRNVAMGIAHRRIVYRMKPEGLSHLCVLDGRCWELCKPFRLGDLGGRDDGRCPSLRCVSPLGWILD